MFKGSRLALKFTVGFILLGILICGASSLIGYHQYKKAIEKQYNDSAYRCAEVALSYIETDTLSKYVKAVRGFRAGAVPQEEIDGYRNTDEYKEADERIETLRAAMGANDILIFSLDSEEMLSYDGERTNWTPLLYIFDSYTVSEQSHKLGDAGSFNPKYIGELDHIASTGERSDNYFFSKGEYGYNTAALLPVTENNQVIAIAAVEIPMVTLQASLRKYIIYAALVIMILIALFISVYMLYLYRKVVSPIKLITAKAEGFVKNHNQVTNELKVIRSGDEIQLLAESILKMQVEINEYIDNLARVTEEKERIGAELKVATHIQSSMLPCIFPPFPHRKEFDIYASMDPAKEVGGDFFDFFLVDEKHLAVVIADVSGKGVPAALFMVIGKTLIKDHTHLERPLGEVFSDVNNILCASNREGLFITAFEGILNLETGEFAYVNAGHEAPCICRKGGAYEPYKVRPGFVLAGMEDMRYREGSVQLEPGDKVFLYTDGVPEAANVDNEIYGKVRMLDILNRHTDKTPEVLLYEIRADVDRFVEEALQFDDITMLCLEYRERMPGEV